MTKRSIRPVRLNHMNAVVEDFDASVGHFTGRYGSELMIEMPQKEFHACLFELGRGIFELFVPYDFLVSVRYGPHYVGLEWQADIDEVRASVADHDMRIIRDIGLALHTHPADGFGVSYEFYGDYFHDRDWDLLGGPIKSAAWWRDEHPLGLTGLIGYSHAVENIDAAQRFLTSFLGAEHAYERDRQHLSARALGLRVADATIELLAPDGEGHLSRHLYRHGEGVRTTLFGVRDIAKAHDWLVAQGFPVEAGGTEGRLVIPAEANRGLMFEFVEGTTA